MSQLVIYKFRLYVAGSSANSVQATANLQAFCREHLPDRHEIEIVDMLRESKRALAEGVLLTPTLVLLAPAPVTKIIGTLSQSAPLLRVCGLTDPPPR